MLLLLRLLLRSPWANRLSRGVPVARLLLAADLAILAQRHLRKLDRAQHARLFTLLVRSRGRQSLLTPAERLEFMYLVATLEPRLLIGSVVGRLSPVPVPKRLLYGRRGSSARAALSRRT
jgi:hypothetical protein